jgi:cation diffusion facilitator family transporter
MSLDTELEQLTHDHVFLGNSHDRNARRTLWVVLLTAGMMVVEIVAGVLFNSMALLADGFHMATHAGALGVAAIAYAYAKKHANSRRYSFGTGKVGDLAGFASAMALGLVALGIAVESAQRLLSPQSVAFGEATVIAVVGLLVNLASAWLLGADHHRGHGHGHDHGHHHGHHDHAHGHDHHNHDNNLRSAYVHVLADALTSVLAILALLGGRYLGWVWLDPVMGLVGATVIAVWSWSLMRDTASVLLDAHESHLEEEIREFVEGPGDARITDLHVWRVGPGAHAAIVAVKGIDGDTVRSRLHEVHEIAHLTVEHRI